MTKNELLQQEEKDSLYYFFDKNHINDFRVFEDW
jgi:hypothetical protein